MTPSLLEGRVTREAGRKYESFDANNPRKRSELRSLRGETEMYDHLGLRVDCLIMSKSPTRWCERASRVSLTTLA
jgi:hypothetical protein